MFAMSKFQKQCKRCHHAWLKRNLKDPRVCPQCKRYDWDKPEPVPAMNTSAKRKATAA
jgi:predicted Zn-ribbon and HTH transcriptional regulator